MTKTLNLPPHIRQLVDKKNYVIAIKTHAQEQGISMTAAKDQIDAYEQQQQSGNADQSVGNFNQLSQGLDNYLHQENIKVPLIPRWVWRVSIIILVMLVLAFGLYRLFGN